MRVLVELQVPKRLLLLALLVGLEVVHQILDLLDLGLGIGVHDLGKILHQPEVGAHGVSETRKLAKLWDQRDFLTSAAVLVDEEGLVGVLDGLIVASLVVIGIARLRTLLVEASHRGLRKVNTVHLVRLLVVLGDDSGARHALLDCIVSVLVAPFSASPNVLHELEHGVSADDLEAHIHIQKTALLLHDESGVKAGPHLDVVGVEAVSIRLVE